MNFLSFAFAQGFGVGIFAASTPAATVSGFLDGVGELFTWTLSRMTELVTWCLGNPLAFVYLGMFISGFAAAFLFRVLRSL